MKFGHLIKWDIFFLEKSYLEYDEDISPRPFFKHSKIEHMSGLTVWSFIQFFLYAQVEDYQKYLNGTGFFEISGNMFIVIVCYPICDSINLNICHSFLAQRFCYKTKKEALLKNKARIRSYRGYIYDFTTSHLHDESIKLRYNHRRNITCRCSNNKILWKSVQNKMCSKNFFVEDFFGGRKNNIWKVVIITGKEWHLNLKICVKLFLTFDLC